MRQSFQRKHRSTLRLLRQYITENIVLALNEKDRGLYGQVLFAPNRNDVSSKEKNTKEEDELFRALYKHYSYESSSELENVFDQALQQSKNPKYDLLVPHVNNIYRVIGVNQLETAELLGISIEDLEKAFKDSEDPYITHNITLNPSKGQLMSWSADKSANLSEIVGRIKGEYIVACKAPVKGNVALMDPYGLDVIDGLPAEAYEEFEVITKGPVKNCTVAVLPNPKKTNTDSSINYVEYVVDELISWL